MRIVYIQSKTFLIFPSHDLLVLGEAERYLVFYTTRGCRDISKQSSISRDEQCFCNDH